MTTTNNIVFWVLHILAWLIFVALSIEAGGLLVNFAFSVFKPEMVQNLYQKLDLSQMYNESQMVFFGVYGFILAISIMKAVMFFIVVRLMYTMDLKKPFSSFVSTQIFHISYLTIAIGLFSHLARQITKNLTNQGFITKDLDQFWEDTEAFVLMGAVIYIIAIIFRKGVEIQHENELTV